VRRELIANCFPHAQAEMTAFFGCLASDGGQQMVSEDLFARMYQSLKGALEKEHDPAARERLLQLAGYTRCAELEQRYLTAQGVEKESAAFELADLLLATRGSLMFDYRIVNRMPEIKAHPEKLFPARVSRKNPREFPPLLTGAELEKIVDDGASRNRRITFEPRTWSTELVPFEPQAAPGGEPAPENLRFSKKQEIYWWAPKAGAQLALGIKSGYRTVGERLPVKVSIRLVDDPIAGQDGPGEPVDKGEVPCDLEWHPVTLTARHAGLHFLEINDGFNQTEVSWPAGEKITVPSGVTDTTFLRGKYDVVFLVPAGVSHIGGYSQSPAGQLLGEKGELLFDFTSQREPDYFDVPIPPARHPRIFRLKGAVWNKRLMTVPPYLARSRSELLVPREALAPSL